MLSKKLLLSVAVLMITTGVVFAQIPDNAPAVDIIQKDNAKEHRKGKRIHKQGAPATAEEIEAFKARRAEYHKKHPPQTKEQRAKEIAALQAYRAQMHKNKGQKPAAVQMPAPVVSEPAEIPAPVISEPVAAEPVVVEPAAPELATEVPAAESAATNTVESTQ